MKYTEVFFPGLIFNKRNRCFLKEVVGYIQFYTSVFTFGLSLDSTPHEYKSKEGLSCSTWLSCSRFFAPAFVLVQHRYGMVVLTPQWISKRLHARDGVQCTSVRHSWPKRRGLKPQTLLPQPYVCKPSWFLVLPTNNHWPPGENKNVFEIGGARCHTSVYGHPKESGGCGSYYHH